VTRRLLLAAAAVALFAAGALAAPAGASPQEPRLRDAVYGSQINGFQFRNIADPSILVDGGRYYAYGSNQTGSFPLNVSVVDTADFDTWDPGTGVPAPRDALPNLPSWARPRSQGGAVWAPSVIRAGGKYNLYFAAKHRNASSSDAGWCIGIATSNNPRGPFTPRQTPFFCQVHGTNQNQSSLSRSPATHKGAIDPQVFRAPNGRLFLYFKALDNVYQLWGVPLTATGRAISGPARGLVPIASNANVWERSSLLGFTVLENPAMVHNNGPGAQRRFVLFYSGGEWQRPVNNYGTGYALCSSPLGPCARQSTTRPWLVTRGQNAGPGAGSVFRGPDGTPWLAYGTFRRDHVQDGWGRRLHVEPLSFSGPAPHLRRSRPTGTIVASPAGGGAVDLTGTADDPDTPRAWRRAGLRVTIRDRNHGNVVVARAMTGALGNWTAPQLTGQSLEQHRYCAQGRDDTGLTPANFACVMVTVT
jgi:hypothetical protein